MPKDIVSGDFFWMDTKDDLAFVAVADCTGHGVPGAFMSIVGLDLLRDILSLGIETPAEILDRLNNEVTKIFKSKDNGDAAVKDGMDIVICAIDKKKRELQFAGAMNPLYVLRNNEIVEIKGDRFSIGPQSDDTYRNFTNHVVPLQKDDVIYMFSDGYADQFGGMSEKKFKIRRFRHLLLNIWNHDFEYQKLTLPETFHNWKQDHEQVDDVIVLGLKPLA
jgi:serine phosphatase RsbU (regulator of sigma subunit)